MNFRNRKINLKPYLWILPFICGLLSIISIFTPAGYLEIPYYFEKVRPINFWMWGMWVNKGITETYYYSYYITKTIFLKDVFLTHGIISSCLILILGIIIMINAIKMRKEQTSFRSNRSFWGISGILLIAIIVIWIIEISFLSYYDVLYELYNWADTYSPPTADQFSTPFWFYFKMDFGVIGPLISGGLLLFSRMLSKG